MHFRWSLELWTQVPPAWRVNFVSIGRTAALDRTGCTRRNGSTRRPSRFTSTPGITGRQAPGRHESSTNLVLGLPKRLYERNSEDLPQFRSFGTASALDQPEASENRCSGISAFLRYRMARRTAVGICRINGGSESPSRLIRRKGKFRSAPDAGINERVGHH